MESGGLDSEQGGGLRARSPPMSDYAPESADGPGHTV